MTILLVVVGTISLVIGFVQSSLLPIYISIACSVVAAAVLLIFSRMTAKSQRVVTADGGPAPLAAEPARRERTEPVPAFSGTGLLDGPGSGSGETFAPEADLGGRPVDDESDHVVDDDFPIERYDSRRVGEILPLLAELDLDELDLVREREEQGKSRATVLARIDQLIDQLEAEDRHEAATRFDEDDVTAGVGAVAPPAVDDDDEDDLADEVPIPVPARTAQTVSVAALPDDDGYFPIEDYDDLRASEILPLLPELDDDELAMVQGREQATAARPSVLRRIDALMGSSGGAAPVDDEPEPEPVTVSAPVVTSMVPSSGAVRKASAKKAPAKRASAKKAAVAIEPAPVQPAPVRPRKTSRTATPAPVVATTVRKVSPRKAAPAPAPAMPLPAKAAAKKARPAATAEVVTTVRAKKAPAAGTTKKVPAPKVVAVKATTAKGAAPATKAAKVTRKATKG